MRGENLRRHECVLGLAALCGGCGGGVGTVRDCSRPGAFSGTRTDGPTPWPLAEVARGAMSAVDSARFDDVMRDLLDTVGTPAISAAVSCDAGEWHASIGLSCTRPSSAVDAQTVFYWASVGKAITAVLVLQLVEAGRLRLIDTLDRWFPRMPEAPRITLDHLLTHTSGLATNTTRPPLGEAYEPPEVLLPEATPSPFCPGEGFNYSNTGYLLLGLIAEWEGGLAFHERVRQRIAQPLGLASLRALQPAETANDVAVAHLAREPRPDGGMSSRLGMGNIVARAEDMLSFWRALLCGHLLQAATLRRQWAVLSGLPGTDHDFGQGVMQVRWTDAAARARVWWGHLGGTPTANALVAWDPLVQAFVAVAVNSEVSSAAVANRLLARVEGLC